MKRTAVLIVALATTASLVFAASAAPSVPPDALTSIAGAKSAALHLVLMASDPVATYDGDVAGPAATMPAPGERLDASTPAARAYAEVLRAEHDAALDDAGVATGARLYDYTVAVNGFAARLSAAEAAALASLPEVLAVIPDQLRRPATDSSPGYLELDNPQGAWATGYTGEDVVVGVIDTGIWPEHPSFAADGYRDRPDGFTPSGCEFGATAFNPDDADFACGGKLVTARAFGEAFHGGSGDGLAAGEFLSARDADGHGSHVAATAAGNQDVAASMLGAAWAPVSGVAPRARLAVYKACWATGPGESACSTADLVAAIDQAVADGVDVINYSVGSGSATFGVDELAFLFTTAAGIPVATPAGNSGPGGGTIAAPATAPWVTSVGAATHDRTFQGSVTLGDGTVLTGVSITAGTTGRQLISGEAAGNAECDPAVSFSTDITRAIVVCARGTVTRIAKGQAVNEQGGSGMILVNSEAGDSLDTDSHFVPTVHLEAADAATLDAYLEAAGSEATAVLSGAVPALGGGGVVAAFSSRGPGRLSADIIKPDLVAPGVDILAATSPGGLLGVPGQLFRALGGTSMAAAHVAGVYAMLVQAHPDWSPAMAKSALVTSTRRDVYAEDGETPAEAFDMGAGYLWPGPKVYQRGSAFNPGLVYDAGVLDYTAFACGAGLGSLLVSGTCDDLAAQGYPTDASDVNLPSIAVADVAQSQAVTRTVTSVADKTRVFTAEVRQPPGFSVEVSPATLTLAPGETASFTVTFTPQRADLDVWRFGILSWVTDGYRVVSPLAVRAVAFTADVATTGAGESGTARITVGFGYSGGYQPLPTGLVPPEVTSGSVDADPSQDINTALASGTGISLHTIEVTDTTRVVRVAVDGETGDLDLYVFGANGAFVAGSGSTMAVEQVDFVPTHSGSYTVAVHGFATGDRTVDYDLSTWLAVDEADAGFVVTDAPPSAANGETAVITVSWTDLETDTVYLGALKHVGPSGNLGQTMVSIDTGANPATASPSGPVQPAIPPPG
ncbi:MAG: S8 family serine peptidase [Acidimicrobiia bacterium]|nr:S8 family serine peptidase [Acidimicrobiia bacterium]